MTMAFIPKFSIERREEVAQERRHWVRLTRACNNRCLFCLDSGAQDGTVVPETEVLRRIEEGRAQGATRLILSGGEPTIHPKFLDFIRFGREVGYTWIQTVTNGRMFRYRRFATSAVEAGLREATFSMHGHRPALHDRLVGHEGAFEQALTGLYHLLNLGVVVSVDIVLNRLNLPYLREILDFYIALGVREFDLLQLVPFGRAFDENRDLLFPDDDMLQRELDRALKVMDTEDVVIWTNRLPIQYLEGREYLFQDPHKIYDEVLGEREAFRLLFSKGIEPECLGPRCPHCFLKGFCDAARHYAQDKRTGVDVTPELTREVLEAIRSGKAPFWPGSRFKLPLRESISETKEVAPDLPSLLEFIRSHGVTVLGLPPCLGGPSPEGPAWPLLDPEVLRPDGTIDLERFVAFYNRSLYRVKSLRCRKCTFYDRCPGIFVNYARLWGLSVLSPISQVCGAPRNG